MRRTPVRTPPRLLGERRRFGTSCSANGLSTAGGTRRTRRIGLVGGVARWPERVVEAVLPNLAQQRPGADAQHLGRLLSAAPSLVQALLDRGPFQIGKRCARPVSGGRLTRRGPGIAGREVDAEMGGEQDLARGLKDRLFQDAL